MAFSAFWKIFELKMPRKEPKWHHDMSGNILDQGVLMVVVVSISIFQEDCEIQNNVY
jgi:hypothetical protein